MPKPHKAEGHHFCVPTGDEYGRCCKCGAQRGYRPILDGPCINEDEPDACGAADTMTADRLPRPIEGGRA